MPTMPCRGSLKCRRSVIGPHYQFWALSAGIGFPMRLRYHAATTHRDVLRFCCGMLWTCYESTALRPHSASPVLPAKTASYESYDMTAEMHQ